MLSFLTCQWLYSGNIGIALSFLASSSLVLFVRSFRFFFLLQYSNRPSIQPSVYSIHFRSFSLGLDFGTLPFPKFHINIFFVVVVVVFVVVYIVFVVIRLFETFPISFLVEYQEWEEAKNNGSNIQILAYLYEFVTCFICSFQRENPILNMADISRIEFFFAVISNFQTIQTTKRWKGKIKTILKTKKNDL